MIDNEKWKTMEIPNNWWWQIIGNDRPGGKADSGKVCTMGMRYNGDERQLGIIDNGKWQTMGEYQLKWWWHITMGNDRTWGMADNGELYIMEMRDNKGWKTIRNYIK